MLKTKDFVLIFLLIACFGLSVWWIFGYFGDPPRNDQYIELAKLFYFRLERNLDSSVVTWLSDTTNRFILTGAILFVAGLVCLWLGRCFHWISLFDAWRRVFHGRYMEGVGSED